MKNAILSHLSQDCPWQDHIYWYDTIDSTNTRAKELARQGAPQGTVLVAGTQTGGRGRLGRSFSSPQGMGVYLSLILRPQCSPDQLMHLTCATAVAMCQAVSAVSGLCPGIKWTNDLVIGKRKLGGILTEVSVNPQTGLLDYAIVGIGINCLQQKEDFPPELQEMATSLAMASGKEVSPALLAAAMIDALFHMQQILLPQKASILDAYRKNCITLGQEIQIIRPNHIETGKAVDLDEDGGLVVVLPDGSIQTVTSGEVSIRGMYGYL